MPLQQKIFALTVCMIVFAFTIELVRRRRLREEYSVLWLATSAIMFVLVLKYDWLVALTGLIGAGLPTTTLFIGAIIFLMLIAVQFSIKVSKLTDQVKNLAQENALLRGEIENVSREKGES
ncbi:MAG: DUF2304 domain-containing protein [Geobacter sp.]|nr:DUF2304 domain-containing protein [Geobacter sp.]